MKEIKLQGFYISEPFHWIDWHAGHKFEGDNYYLIKFDKNKCFFDSLDNKDEINIEN